MRPVRSLLIYGGIVFAGGALLAPWLYRGVQLVTTRLGSVPFHRCFDRALLVLAVAGLWPLLRGLGVRSWKELGLVPPVGYWKKLTGGFAFGFATLACAVGVTLAVGARTVNAEVSPGRLGGKILGATATAAVVAVIEEILFRGGIFGGLRKILRWQSALLISSAIYAIVHFLSPAELSGEITWTSGFVLLPLKLRGFLDLEQILPDFFNLTLAGAMLALAYQRTGNLYFSIGLHAGWIFWLKSCGFLTREVAGSNGWFWGSAKLIDGWLAPVVLTLALSILLKLLPRREDADVPSVE